MRRTIIYTVNLTRNYQVGDQVLPVLRETNFSVRQGEFVALMGASGSGKSTLLGLLGLLDRATSGEYWLEGLAVFTLTQNELSALRGKRIGFIFQNFNLLPRLSAWENVALPLSYQNGNYSQEEQRQRAKEALARVGLNHRLDHYPMKLSGGERQRVTIARALITNPAVILADEPTGNLDSRRGEEIMRLLRELHQDGSTIVMVTHDTSIAGYANRICTMRDGVLSEN
ncbi:MAG: ABC transporter ATP-binding protein [Chloroflexi bacterium]|nr:ABC transporter ATP-binding protein [Chloroflexota bacterium]